MLPPVDYDNGLYRGYEQGRGLREPALRSWRAGVARRLPVQRPLAVLELGSGTGRFSRLVAEITAGPVYAIEPSRRMRIVAAKEHPHPGVHHIAGRAEAIPMATASTDAVVMFFVWHHISDLPTAAREIARVLRPGGRLLIAGSFSERLHPRGYYHYMPTSRRIEAQLFPALSWTQRVLDTAGMITLGLDEIDHEVAESLAAYSARLAQHAISTFEYLTEDEIAEGLRRLAADAAAETSPQLIRHTHDLLTVIKR